MIRYALHCDAGHEFEAWFASSAAFDAQAKRGRVECPNCGSREVEKSVMAPNIATGPRRDGPHETRREADKNPRPRHGDDALAAVRSLREHVVRHSDFVGDRFAEEARKIHYKEVKPRGIYGAASDQEARELREEGVEFHPLPTLPEDRN